VRVLHVTHNYPRHAGDAAGSFVARLVRAQRAAGHEVRVLAPHAAGLPVAETLDGVPITRFRYAPDAAETLAYTGTMAEQVRASFAGKARLVGMLRATAVATARARRDAPPTVIHAHWWFPVGLALTLPGARGDVPLVTTMHGSDVRLAQGALARALLQRVLRGSRGAAAVSRWLADEATRLGGRRVAVAPMPVAGTCSPPAATGRATVCCSWGG
jgi:glycosyltransferase involved in cell wall biosynthesis